MDPVGASERWDRCSEKGWPGGRHGEASEFAVAGATGSDGTSQRRLQEGDEDEDTLAATGMGCGQAGGKAQRNQENQGMWYHASRKHRVPRRKMKCCQRHPV